MRTTLNIDDDLLGRATELSGLREKTAVVRAGLEAHRQGRRPSPGGPWWYRPRGAAGSAPSADHQFPVILVDRSLGVSY